MASSHSEMIRHLKGYDVDQALAYIATREGTVNRNPVTVFHQTLGKSIIHNFDIAKYLKENESILVNDEKLRKVGDNVYGIVSDDKKTKKNRQKLMNEKNVFINRTNEESDSDYIAKVIDKVFDDAKSNKFDSLYARDSVIAPNNKSFLQTPSLTIYPNVNENVVEGVNTPMWYIGGPGSLTSLHVEDGDFASINILLQGESKIWGIIDQKQFPRLAEKVKEHVNDEKECHLFHKPGYIIHHSLLKEWNIDMENFIQEVGDLVYISEATLHFVVNTGLNMAEAINYGTSASTVKPDITFCECDESTVGRMRRRKFVFRKVKESSIKENKKTTYTCNIDDCKKEFLYKQSYDTHVFEAHCQLPINCRDTKCKKKFRTRQAAYEHFKSVHSQAINTVKCPECSQRFFNASTCKRHIKRIHRAKETETCETCKKEMLKTNLVKHSKRCNGAVECNECQRMFSKKKGLITHIKHCDVEKSAC